MTTAQDLKWRVEPSADLSDLERKRYAEITASYGGTGGLRREFRRYRVAEICARSIRSSLGVHSTIAPRRDA